MEERDVREAVYELLESISGDSIVRSEPDINLVAEELIDSLGYTELLIGIEETTGVIMAPTELTREEMDTPEKIIRQVLSRMGKAK